MESTTCENCGCTEFTRQSGYYICSNCDTQSQDIQVQSFDFVDVGRLPNNDEDAEREVVRSQSQQERLPTSWECYNIVFKGLVEQLIKLGASPRLKVTSFQLWALYLKKANVAFTSTTEEKLPSLPLGFKIKDVNALYGIPNLRKKLFKNYWGREGGRKRKTTSDQMSVSSQSSKGTQHSRRRKHRKIFMAEANETSRISSDNDSSYIDSLDTVDRVMAQRSRRHKSVLFKKSAKKALSEIMNQVKTLEENRADESVKRRMKITIRRKVYDYRRCPKENGKRCHNMITNTAVLISILRVALLLLKEEIMLGDILRWICEGRLSVNQPENFMPEFYRYVKKSDFANISRRGLQLDIKNFTTNVGLSHIPTPNLFKLLKRYCDDLCLPAEFFKVALKIMSDKCPEMCFSNFKLSFPDYECRTMAYILFTFKLLFSLDDFTEHHLDQFAKAVNEQRKLILVPDEEIPKLFSWSQWVKYIECRKAVLAKYDVAVNQLAYNDRVDNEEVFEEYWKAIKPTYKTTATSVDQSFFLALQNYIRNSQAKHPDRSRKDITFPVSLTPSVTGIKYLLEKHPELIYEKSRKILSDDFDTCSVTYGVNFELCENTAAATELDIEFLEDYRNSEVQNYKKGENKLLAFSKTSLPPVFCPTDVIIQNDLEFFENEKEHVCEKFESKITNFETTKSDDPNPENEENIVYKIYNPSKRYWFFHEFYRRISVEEFDALIAENLPTSFLWLLKECASVLRVDSKELYLELIIIESTLCCKYIDSSYDQYVSLQIREKEW